MSSIIRNTTFGQAKRVFCLFRLWPIMSSPCHTVPKYPHTYTHTYMYTNVHTYRCTCIHTHTHTYIHTPKNWCIIYSFYIQYTFIFLYPIFNTTVLFTFSKSWWVVDKIGFMTCSAKSTFLQAGNTSLWSEPWSVFQKSVWQLWAVTQQLLKTKQRENQAYTMKFSSCGSQKTVENS